MVWWFWRHVIIRCQIFVWENIFTLIQSQFKNMQTSYLIKRKFKIKDQSIVSTMPRSLMNVLQATLATILIWHENIAFESWKRLWFVNKYVILKQTTCTSILKMYLSNCSLLGVSIHICVQTNRKLCSLSEWVKIRYLSWMWNDIYCVPDKKIINTYCSCMYVLERRNNDALSQSSLFSFSWAFTMLVLVWSFGKLEFDFNGLLHVIYI